MSPFISVTRRSRRRLAPSVIAVLLAAIALLAGFALPAFGLSPSKLISEALSTAKRADKDAKKADKDAKNSTVGTGRLRNGAVTAGKIATGAVGNGQLAGNSVAGKDIIAGSVGSAALTSGSVGSAQLATGGVASSDLANGSVTSDKLASGSVGTPQIIPRSVSIEDLSGTSTNTTFDLPAVDANTCSTAEVSDPDAAITDFPMISFPGPANLPLQVSATALRVDTAGSVLVKFCNGTSVDAAAGSGVNVEVVTLR